MAEFDFIDWVKSQTALAPTVLVGPGDDCALLQCASPQLITTDMLMDGVDFILKDAGARQVGRKAMAVNLSDIAAMAGVPTHAVVSVALPIENGANIGKELFLGIQEIANEFGVSIVGGDTNSWPGPLVVNVTLWGTPSPKGAVLRSGAQVGDAIIVTGELGGSILGRHLSPTPRVKEALQLAAMVDLHAMIDISDGLSQDLNHILKASGVGAVLEAKDIPISEAAKVLAKQTGKTPLQHALSDGEDFELVFMVNETDAAKLRQRAIPHTRIGTCIEGGLWLREGELLNPLLASGWVHPLGP